MRVTPCQANVVNDNVVMIDMVYDVIAMISKVNVVGSNNREWWVDAWATRHVCANKSMFYSFRAFDNREKLYMGNFATADIKGKGDVTWRWKDCLRHCLRSFEPVWPSVVPPLQLRGSVSMYYSLCIYIGLKSISRIFHITIYIVPCYYWIEHWSFTHLQLMGRVLTYFFFTRQDIRLA